MPNITLTADGGGRVDGAPTITVLGSLILNSTDSAIGGGLVVSGLSGFIFSTPTSVEHLGGQWALYVFGFKYRREEQA